MKYLLVLALIVVSCSKVGRDAVSPDQLALQMSHDEDVQIYFAVVKQHTEAITRPFSPTGAASDSLKKPPTLEDITRIVNQHPERMEFLVSKATVIHKRYNLQRYTEAELRQLFERVMTRIEQEDPAGKRKKLKARPASNPAAWTEPGNEYLVSFAFYRSTDDTTVCVDWYYLTYDHDGVPLYQTYAYTECVPVPTGTYNPGGEQTAEGDSTHIFEDVCMQDLAIKRYRCDRDAQIISSAVFITAVIALILTRGKITKEIVSTLVPGLSLIALQHYVCLGDALADYQLCVARARENQNKP